VALVAVLEFEFRGLFFGNFHRPEVVRQLSILIKAFPLGSNLSRARALEHHDEMVRSMIKYA